MRYCGYSELFHDAGLAFVEDGEIELAVHAERFSGLKFDHSLTQEMFDMIRDDDHVTFYEDHDIRNKSIYHKGAISKFDHDVWIDAMFRPVTNRHLQNLNNISSGLVYDDCITHHQSHAAAAYYTRPWESSEDTVILTIDGMGEAQSVCIYDHNLKLLDHWNNPKSIGIYYTQTVKSTGYRTMEDEYVIMGLSAYGNNEWGDEFIKKFDALPPYDPDEPDITTRLMYESMHQYCIWIHEQIKKSSHEDSAASIQKFAEHFIIDRVIEARKYGKKLCYGGGVAQNVVANSMIKELGIFDDIWIAPSPTDAGSALGAAAHSYCIATQGILGSTGKTPSLAQR